MYPSMQTAANRDELSTALRRVCADPAFKRSPQLRRLLEYLVQAALAGDAHPKEYTIAVEALGRSERFDPDQDAIVRVQAGRLRRALEKYYATQGRDDPIRIVLPTGTYALHCERQSAAKEDPPSEARSWGLRAALVAGVMALIAVAVTIPTMRDMPTAPPGAPPAATAITNGLPNIVILPFEGPGAEVDDPALIGLERRIASTFSRFETVNVVLASRPMQPERRSFDGEPVYDLSTVVTLQKGGVRILFQLSDRTAGTIVWARAFDVSFRGDADAQQEHVVRRLASTLLQPFGVITSRDRARHLRTGLGDLRYRCVLRAMDALREAAEAGYQDARGCLEKVTETDPSNALAHSYLALILNRHFQYGRPNQPDVLERALVAARHAVRTNPISSRAYFALFVTRYNMREFDAAETAMETARAFNDYDLVMRSEHAGRLVARGRIDEGLSALDAIDDAFPARSCAHGFYAFLGHYMRGNAPEARRRANELACPTYPYAFLAKALAAIDAGEPQAAWAALDLVAAFLPGWRADPRAALGRTIPDAAIVDRIMRDLAAAGQVTAIGD